MSENKNFSEEIEKYTVCYHNNNCDFTFIDFKNDNDKKKEQIYYLKMNTTMYEKLKKNATQLLNKITNLIIHNKNTVSNDEIKDIYLPIVYNRDHNDNYIFYDLDSNGNYIYKEELIRNTSYSTKQETSLNKDLITTDINKPKLYTIYVRKDNDNGGKKRRTKKAIKTTKKAVKKHRRKTNKTKK